MTADAVAWQFLAADRTGLLSCQGVPPGVEEPMPLDSARQAKLAFGLGYPEAAPP